jgi:hypothetical protein
MNTSQDRAADELPELDDERIEEIEHALFARIARDRGSRRARRGRLWMGGAAAAAVVVVAALAAPVIVPMVTGSTGAAGSAVSEEAGSAPVLPDGVAGGADTQLGDGARDTGADGGAAESQADSVSGRDILTTASATVVVADVGEAATRVGATAEQVGGYVESMSVGQSGQVTPADPMVVDGSYPYPYPAPDGAWVTVRVPADSLDGVIAELRTLGEVTSSSISRQDVTQQTIDLQARIAATQASVDRLTELMSQAGDISDLIAAETALSERQALLESYQQQLETLDDQVAMSTLTVSLTPEAEPVEADPAGFTDGLAAGWNGLVATLNGIVIALGFLLPWILLIAAVGGVVWAIVRLFRRRRGTRGTGVSPADASGDETMTASPRRADES